MNQGGGLELSTPHPTTSVCSFLLPCSSSSSPHQGKPQGGSVAIQLPGKLFTDFEAWDPLRLQGRRPETRGPKYCHSSFDAITVGKMVPPAPRFLLSSPQHLQGSPELKYKVGRVAIIKSRNPKSQALLRVASPRQAKPCSLLHFRFCPSCAHSILSAGSSHQFGKLGSREAPPMEGKQKAEGHSSTLSWLRADGQQRLYVFQGNQFWEVTADGNVSEPRPLRERWAGLPPHIEAAAVSLEDGDFYFFKGTSPGADEKIES